MASKRLIRTGAGLVCVCVDVDVDIRVLDLVGGLLDIICDGSGDIPGQIGRILDAVFRYILIILDRHAVVSVVFRHLAGSKRQQRQSHKNPHEFLP